MVTNSKLYLFASILFFFSPSLLADSYQLINAVRNNNLKEVKELIRSGTDVNIKDRQGWTPLHSVNGTEIAELLLTNGADIGAKDNIEQTPSSLAFYRNKREIRELFHKAELAKRGISRNETKNFRVAKLLGDDIFSWDIAMPETCISSLNTNQNNPCDLTKLSKRLSSHVSEAIFNHYIDKFNLNATQEEITAYETNQHSEEQIKIDNAELEIHFLIAELENEKLLSHERNELKHRLFRAQNLKKNWKQKEQDPADFPKYIRGRIENANERMKALNKRIIESKITTWKFNQSVKNQYGGDLSDYQFSSSSKKRALAILVNNYHQQNKLQFFNSSLEKLVMERFKINPKQSIGIERELSTPPWEKAHEQTIHAKMEEPFRQKLSRDISILYSPIPNSKYGYQFNLKIDRNPACTYPSSYGTMNNDILNITFSPNNKNEVACKEFMFELPINYINGKAVIDISKVNYYYYEKISSQININKRYSSNGIIALDLEAEKHNSNTLARLVLWFRNLFK